MTSSKLPTEFAPAERLSAAEIGRQSEQVQSLFERRRLFDAVPDIYMLLNSHRQIVFCNSALVQAAGAPDELAVMGRHIGEVLDCIHALASPAGCGTADFCRTCGAVRAILSGLRGWHTVEECRISRSDGDALDLRVWATPLVIEGERYVAFVVKDISHEKRRRVLEHVFFHDILNTAGGVRGLAEILPRVPPDDQSEIHDLILGLADRLIDEIASQQQLAAAETNELVINRCEIESRQFLAEIATPYRNHDAAGRFITIAPDAQTFTFISDRALLGRVIGNMIKNALEASAPGETITLSCCLSDGMAEFSVHNPGVMPRDVQLQVFQRSYSTKGSGRGLGTYSMKLLSERYLHGVVSFASSAEHGTLFTARYPRVLPE